MAIKNGWGRRKTQALDEAIRRFVVLGFDEATVRSWAELKAEAEMQGQPKSTAELWVAATARRHGLPLLTNDRGFLKALAISVVRPEDEPGTSAI